MTIRKPIWILLFLATFISAFLARLQSAQAQQQGDMVVTQPGELPPDDATPPAPPVPQQQPQPPRRTINVPAAEDPQRAQEAKSADSSKGNQADSDDAHHSNIGVGLGSYYQYYRQTPQSDTLGPTTPTNYQLPMPALQIHGYTQHLTSPVAGHADVSAQLFYGNTLNNSSVQKPGFDSNAEVGFGYSTGGTGLNGQFGLLFYGDASQLPGGPLAAHAGLGLELGPSISSGRTTAIVSGVAGFNSSLTDFFSGTARLGARLKFFHDNDFFATLGFDWLNTVTTITSSQAKSEVTNAVSYYNNQLNSTETSIGQNASQTANQVQNGTATSSSLQQSAQSALNSLQSLGSGNNGLSTQLAILTSGLMVYGSMGYELLPHLMLEGWGSVSNAPVVTHTPSQSNGYFTVNSSKDARGLAVINYEFK